MGVSRTKDEFVFVGKNKKGKPKGRWAKMMNVTLSCDHRVIDGAIAAKWLGNFKDYIENPFKLVL